MADDSHTVYPLRVVHEISADTPGAYQCAADFINHNGYDILSVQHEYGIFGGESGEMLLLLLREVQLPIVTTMHTVLHAPSAAQRRVTNELLHLSECIIVMSESAIRILVEEYGLPETRVQLIPHGTPDFSKAGQFSVKERLGIDGPMLLTFGFLSPDKGIQYAIEAMPGILTNFPTATYVIVGATHPTLRARDGEAYRDTLTALADDLGVSKSVRFVNEFVSQEDLLEYLREADVYLTPYLNPQQITSGTLAYALGADKSIISTGYLYAKDLLSDGRGFIVPFRNSAAIADVATKIIAGEIQPKRDVSTTNLGMPQALWPEVAERYADAYLQAARSHCETKQRMDRLDPMGGLLNEIPAFSTKHLIAMTDDTGMFQHAVLTTPNRSHGYCVDDVARAMLLTTFAQRSGDTSSVLDTLQGRYLAFVFDSFNVDNGRFRNFMGYNREWLESHGSDDSHCRTLWSLAAVTHRSSSGSRQQLAKKLLRWGVPTVYDMRSPRAWAYAILAADEYLTAYPGDATMNELLAEMATRLNGEYRLHRGEDWHWFEDIVSYANGRLSQALIIAGQRLNDGEMLAAGTESLEWLMKQQTCSTGNFRPIGSNGFYPRGGTRALHDQQPLEAWASISACISASLATGDQAWMRSAQNVFAWFLGKNDLRQPVYNSLSGGCRDGIHLHRLNENEGAESTLSFLCSLLEIRPTTALSRHRLTGGRLV